MVEECCKIIDEGEENINKHIIENIFFDFKTIIKIIKKMKKIEEFEINITIKFYRIGLDDPYPNWSIIIFPFLNKKIYLKDEELNYKQLLIIQLLIHYKKFLNYEHTIRNDHLFFDLCKLNDELNRILIDTNLLKNFYKNVIFWLFIKKCNFKKITIINFEEEKENNNNKNKNNNELYFNNELYNNNNNNNNIKYFMEKTYYNVINNHQ